MDLFSPLKLGSLELRNRIIMAPMTRSRAHSDALPSDVMVEYYRQRASAGLIISEGIAPSANGVGYCRTPGIYSEDQVKAWQPVLAAVHNEGGLMVAQLMHVGRVSNLLNKPDGSETVAPSAIAARGDMYTDQQGMAPFDHPRALLTSEISAVVEQYRHATENAYKAGFDGVELHCTSGYLPAQFLSTGSNQREDEYGGCVENRARFVLEVLQAMNSVRGPERVGIRICPDNPFNDLQDDNPEETFEYLLAQAATMNLAYLHVIRMRSSRVDNLALGRRHFADNIIGNDSYKLESAQTAVSSGELAAVSFARHFIGNPDLVERWRSGALLSTFDLTTLYTAGAEGYTSYSIAESQ